MGYHTYLNQFIRGFRDADKNKWLIVVLVLLIVALSGCSNPLNGKYDPSLSIGEQINTKAMYRKIHFLIWQKMEYVWFKRSESYL